MPDNKQKILGQLGRAFFIAHSCRVCKTDVDDVIHQWNNEFNDEDRQRWVDAAAAFTFFLNEIIEPTQLDT